VALLGEFGKALQEADPDREPDTFLFFGETFTVPAYISALPLMEYAAAANARVDSKSIEGLAAMHSLIRACVVADDWARFQTVATANAADDEDLLQVCRAVMAAATARPTVRPSGSSDGPPSTGASSKEPSSSDASSTPSQASPEASLSPIMQDPRVRELRTVEQAAADMLVGV
jgi:hypothetical protein